MYGLFEVMILPFCEYEFKTLLGGQIGPTFSKELGDHVYIKIN